MAKYKFVNVDQLDADLTTIADSIRSKSGKSGTMAFPNGFASAISGISTGITVQRKSGSFTTNTSGSATVSNLGFKPDFVAVDGGDVDGVPSFSAVAFTEANATTVGVNIPPTRDDYAVTYLKITQSSSGFSVSAKDYTGTWQETNCSNRTISYVAIKYT